MNYNNNGIKKHKYCPPCMSDINDKLSKCKISNNKKNKFIIDSVKFTILNLTTKKDQLDK
jgi:hypothetical protein